MPNLSISNAWNETTGIVKRDAQLLFPLAFMLVSLPAAIFQALVPTEPQAQPEPGLWLLLIIPLILITVWGTLAISWLAMRPGSSGSAALGRASTRLLPLVGAVLLLMVGAIILSIPIFVIAAALGGAQALAAGEMTGGLLFAILALIVFYVFFWVRLMLITPSAAAEALSFTHSSILSLDHSLNGRGTYSDVLADKTDELMAAVGRLMRRG
jgi:hypothetical protein